MNSTLLEIPVRSIDGAETSLAPYAGKVLLIVNVASACGFTPQYEGLEKLFESERDRGLVILGFPSNDFGAQEPGSNAEIAEFCSTTFHVEFPMFAKLGINGAERHALYEALIAARPHAHEPQSSAFREQMAKYGIHPSGESDVMWNFEKFLVARDGTVVGRYTSNVTPDDPDLRAAIERELAEPA